MSRRCYICLTAKDTDAILKDPNAEVTYLCSECMEPIREHSFVCVHCGATVITEVEQEEEERAAIERYEREKRAKNNDKAFSLSVLVTVLIMALFFTFMGPAWIGLIWIPSILINITNVVRVWKR